MRRQLNFCERGFHSFTHCYLSLTHTRCSSYLILDLCAGMPPPKTAYNPADYAGLMSKVPEDVRELFAYIGRYTPHAGAYIGRDCARSTAFLIHHRCCSCTLVYVALG